MSRPAKYTTLEEYREANRLRFRAYYQANRELVLAKARDKRRQEKEAKEQQELENQNNKENKEEEGENK